MTWVPDACTLPTAERPLRVAEFDAVLAARVGPVVRPAPTRLVLTVAGGAGRAAAIRDLADRETACCSFVTFSLTDHGDRLTVEVEVPPAHVSVLDALEQRAQP